MGVQEAVFVDFSPRFDVFTHFPTELFVQGCSSVVQNDKEDFITLSIWGLVYCENYYNTYIIEGVPGKKP